MCHLQRATMKNINNSDSGINEFGHHSYTHSGGILLFKSRWTINFNELESTNVIP